MARTFALEVRREGDAEPLVALSEIASDESLPASPRITVSGLAVRVLTATLLETIRKHGYRPTTLLTRQRPFELEESSGVRLGVSLYAVKSLRRSARMEQILEAIGRMPDEEAYYWYAKCSETTTGRRSQRALRIMLAGEDR